MTLTTHQNVNISKGEVKFQFQFWNSLNYYLHDSALHWSRPHRHIEVIETSFLNVCPAIITGLITFPMQSCLSRSFSFKESEGSLDLYSNKL